MQRSFQGFRFERTACKALKGRAASLSENSPGPVDRIPFSDKVIGVQEVTRAVAPVEEPDHDVDAHNGEDVEDNGGHQEYFTLRVVRMGGVRDGLQGL